VSGAMMLILGSGGPSFPSFGGTVSALVPAPSTATAGVTFGTDGSISFNGSGPAADTNWRRPTLAGVGSSFWVRATVNSGTLSSGTSGSWLQLNSARSWTKTSTGAGLLTCSITLQVASDAGGTNIVSSGTYSLQADSS
jgi:hypothetical protein